MKSVVKPVINLKARSAKSVNSAIGRLKVSTQAGLFASKRQSRDSFYKRDLTRQTSLRQKLERAKNAGVDESVKPTLKAKIKQVENTIGLLQKKS